MTAHFTLSLTQFSYVGFTIHYFGLMNDARLNPCVFRFGWMQCKYRRTTSPAKTPLYFPAASADNSITPQFRGRLHLEIFSINPDSNIEGAAIGPPTVFTVAIVGWTEFPGITQLDSAAQAPRFKGLLHAANDTTPSGTTMPLRNGEVGGSSAALGRFPGLMNRR